MKGEMDFCVCISFCVFRNIIHFSHCFPLIFTACEKRASVSLRRQERIRMMMMMMRLIKWLFKLLTSHFKIVDINQLNIFYSSFQSTLTWAIICEFPASNKTYWTNRRETYSRNIQNYLDDGIIIHFHIIKTKILRR